MKIEKPWLTEPDREQLMEHGLPCVIHRNPMTGALNGYAGVADSHPWFGKSYDDKVLMTELPLEFGTREVDDRVSCLALFCQDREKFEAGYVSIDVGISVHGGVTFSGRMKKDWNLFPERDPLWWFGFDCSHAGDLAPGLGDPLAVFDKCGIEVPPEMMDMMRSMDTNAVYRDIAYVRKECRRLAHQLAVVASTESNRQC